MSAGARRILVRLPNPLGDAVMATPALRALRRAHPAGGARRAGAAAPRGAAARQSPLRRVPAGARPPRARHLAPRARAARARLRLGGRAARLAAHRARAVAGAHPAPRRLRARLAAPRAGDGLAAAAARERPPRRALDDRALLPHHAPARRRPTPAPSSSSPCTRPSASAWPPGSRARGAADASAPAGRAGRRLRRLASCGRPSTSRAPATRSRARFGLLPLILPAPNAGRARDRARRRLAHDASAALLVEEPGDLEDLKAFVERAALLRRQRHGSAPRGGGARPPGRHADGPDRSAPHRAPARAPARAVGGRSSAARAALPVCPIDHRCMTRLAPERAVEAAARAARAGLSSDHRPSDGQATRRADRSPCGVRPVHPYTLLLAIACLVSAGCGGALYLQDRDAARPISSQRSCWSAARYWAFCQALLTMTSDYAVARSIFYAGVPGWALHRRR